LRPNVLLITSHDTGRHLGCYGVAEVSSPRIDALAAGGVRMGHCFATVPICCPSRASMMTGRYPQSHGLMDLCFPPFDWEMHEEERHLSHLLREAGYHTRLFGIQHEVSTGRLPRLGFDVLPEGPRAPCDAVAGQVAEFLDAQRASDRPFYAQVGFFETHSPFTWGGAEPDESRGLYIPPYVRPSEAIRGMARELQGSIRKMDAAVGAIVDALDAAGLAGNTILVYTTDHGIEFPRAKWTLYDPGIGIAMVVRWPAGGVTGGRVCERLQSNVDFLPTVLELAGLPVPGNVEGRSFAGALAGRGEPPLRSEVFALYAKRCQGRCVRTRDFKLIRNFDIDRYHRRPVDFTDYDDYGVTPNLELYDLRADPDEFNNLAADPAHEEVRRELGGRLFGWLEEVRDPILSGPLRSPFYERSLRDLRADADDR
jgi:N-sulfoglucosamine sulfohydrolase